MKKLFFILSVIFALSANPVFAQELLYNAGFEESSSSLFGTTFDDWTMPLGAAVAETTDKIEGQQALLMNQTTQTTNYLEQEVSVSSFAEGDMFEIKISYKVLANPNNNTLKTDCYWDILREGRSDHDANVLITTLNEVSNWTTIIIRTTMPHDASKFYFRLTVGKSMHVLFDDFSFRKIDSTDEPEKPSDEPFLIVTPTTLNAVTTELGQSVVFPTIHVSQGNLNSPTQVYITGAGSGHFSVSQNEVENGETDIVVTYIPNAAGSHTAMLCFDPIETSLFTSIPLRASCTDPTAQPTLSVTPDQLPDFTSVATQTATANLQVSSINATDYVYLTIAHIKGSAFQVNTSLLLANTESEIVITFAPQVAGEYESILTISTEGAASKTLILHGTATAASSSAVDWQTSYQWNKTAPLALLDEHFDNAPHNKTLLLNGWQNVADASQRPWWGFSEQESLNVDGTESYAKATAYRWQIPSSEIWTMTLVTPALDAVTAETKVFSFRVMAENIPENEENPATLNLIYIDATVENDIYEEVVAIDMPSIFDDNGEWREFYVDMSSAPLADVFFMAFRYTGPDGDKGAVTYYIDDVSWGKYTMSSSVQIIKQDGVDISLNGNLLSVSTAEPQFVSIHSVDGRRLAVQYGSDLRFGQLPSGMCLLTISGHTYKLIIP